MAAATSRGSLDNLLSIFALLFLHIGCFFFSSTSSFGDCSGEQAQSPTKRRKIQQPPSDDPATDRTLKSISFFSYLGCLLSFRKPRTVEEQQNRRSLHIHQAGDPPTYPSSPLLLISLSPDAGGDGVHVSAESAATNDSVATVAVYPCPACGEVLSKRHLLDLHQAAKHSLSELCDPDSGYNIVRIIFDSGWKGKSPPVVHRVLKIQNSARTLARYEEYRDAVRSRAARYAARTGGGDERCIADGNERLRFYCTTTLCSWNVVAGATVGVCGSPYCCTCAIVRHGFSGKHADMDGIATHATGWGAHASLPEDLEREFACLRARRAMLVCRVVAGRVAHRLRGGAEQEEEEEEKGAGFDSVVPMSGDEGGPGDSGVGEDELLVFSPRAVLPCFVIIYTV